METVKCSDCGQVGFVPMFEQCDAEMICDGCYKQYRKYYDTPTNKIGDTIAYFIGIAVIISGVIAAGFSLGRFIFDFFNKLF